MILTLPLTSDSRWIVFSDCHRGDGSAGDEFARNSMVYKFALEHYLREGFGYIELGDAEELWENRSFVPIYITHTSVYELLRKFHDPDPAKTRYIKIWGNNDLDWRDDKEPLAKIFEGIRVYEEAEIACGDGVAIRLLHGHQADPLCTGLRGSFSRWMVRHVWRRGQSIGLQDPTTRAAENPGRCNEIDQTLIQWAKDKRGHLRESQSNAQGQDKGGHPTIIIAGHTHRPVFEGLSLTERLYLESGFGPPGIARKKQPEPIYYNTGSCVHPRCITGIEITARSSAGGSLLPHFALIKWAIRPAEEKGGAAGSTLTIARTVLQEGI